MNQLTQQVPTIHHSPSGGEQDDAIDVRKYLAILFENKLLIATVALIATLVGVMYVFVARPIYQANILIEVEDTPSSAKNILGNLAGALDVKTMTASEMEILRSRKVVSQAVDNMHLYIEAQPKTFPLIGSWLARRSKEISEPGLLGFGGYAWGAERADVTRFDVPEEMEGESFTLTAIGNNRYRLALDDQGIEATGEVGNTLHLKTDMGDIGLHIERLDGKPGAQFHLTRYARLETVEALQEALKIAEKGKQSSVIGVSLDGPDRKQVTAILNEIGHEYIRQNTAREAEEAEKSLAFLNHQLPAMKQDLERSESALNALRNNRGTIDLGEEAKTILQQSVLAQTKMVELRQKKEDLLTRFQEDHPTITAVNQQLRSLEREMTGVESKIKKLPTVEQDVFRLTRDVKVNTDLYTSLLRSSQQLRLATESKVGTARLLDNAEKPVRPIKPRRALVIAAAAMFGLFLGAIIAIMRKSMYGRINAPEEIKESLGLPVSATIPYSQTQEHLYAQMLTNKKSISVLAHDLPTDSAIESLRSFRASVQFAMRDSGNKIIMITSATPGVGKSFVAVNFAAVLASVGKRVLLIDSDLRKGYLHRFLGLDRKNGLTEIVTGKMVYGQAIHKNVVENVDFISTGELPSKPAELLANENFAKLLQLLSTRYDFVVVDTAPVLAAPDALTVGPLVGAMFNIVRGGVSTVDEVEEAVKRLNQAGATVTGTIFNGLKPRASRYGYAGRYKKYSYAETA